MNRITKSSFYQAQMDTQYSGIVPSNRNSSSPYVASKYENHRVPQGYSSADIAQDMQYSSGPHRQPSIMSPKAVIVDTIKNTFTPTGNVQEDKARGEAWGKALGATPANVEMMGIAASEGWNSAAKQMMANAGGDYASMRAMYG